MFLGFNSYFFALLENFLVANRNKRQMMSHNSTDFALCYILIGQLDVPWADSRLRMRAQSDNGYINRFESSSSSVTQIGGKPQDVQKMVEN